MQQDDDPIAVAGIEMRRAARTVMQTLITGATIQIQKQTNQIKHQTKKTEQEK